MLIPLKPQIMKTKNFFSVMRRPYIAVFLSVLILFASCEQYDSGTIDIKQFDYSLHNEFVTNPYNSGILEIINLSGEKSDYFNSSQRSNELLETINTYYNSDLSFPDEFLSATDNNSQEIPDFLLEMGWINQNDLNLIDKFISDLQSSNFNTALENYEASVLNLNLDDNEFNIKNKAANSFVTMNHYYPEMFQDANYSTSTRSGWGCLRAAIALTAASAALAACATVVACGLAVTGWILAYDAYRDNCLNQQ